MVGMKPVVSPASEGSMRAVRMSPVHVSASGRLGGGGGLGVRVRGHIFFVSLFASVMSLVSLDKSPKRNSDVPTTVLETES